MSKKRPDPTLSEVLRKAVEESGVSYYRISKDTGIINTSLARFVSGETSLRLDKADVLAEYLGLQLVPDPDAAPPEPTPKNLARPTLSKQKAKRPTRRRANKKGE